MVLASPPLWRISLRRLMQKLSRRLLLSLTRFVLVLIFASGWTKLVVRRVASIIEPDVSMGLCYQKKH